MQFDATFLDLVLRWAHVLVVIQWIGWLAVMKGTQGVWMPAVQVEGQGRATARAFLIKGRHGLKGMSMFALILGLAVFFVDMIGLKVYSIPEGGGLSGRGRFIMWGMMLGIALWGLTWFWLLPALKKVRTAVDAGEAPEAGVLARLGLGLRVGAILAITVLYVMLVGPHLGAFHYGHIGLAVVLGFVGERALSFCGSFGPCARC